MILTFNYDDLIGWTGLRLGLNVTRLVMADPDDAEEAFALAQRLPRPDDELVVMHLHGDATGPKPSSSTGPPTAGRGGHRTSRI
jgi:hypothetical protein